MRLKEYETVVIGGSAGSLDVMGKLFSSLAPDFAFPIIVVCHLHPEDHGGTVNHYKRSTGLAVEEAVYGEAVKSGRIYFPPADYHLLVEMDKTFSLSADEKVNYSRPSIDVFFESAAMCWANSLVGIILTGASVDGKSGIAAIKKYGGLTIAQRPDEAAYPLMPRAAIDSGKVDQIWSVDEIGTFLSKLGK
jgi:two-component system chemotaxis response regulator CheB